MLAEASGSQVDVLNPFDLVEVDRKAKSDLPDHVGRLAPLVGFGGRVVGVAGWRMNPAVLNKEDFKRLVETEVFDRSRHALRQAGVA